MKLIKSPYISYIEPVTTAALITGGAALLGSGINAGMQAGTNYSSRKFNREMFKKQAEYNKEMQERSWRRQDELIAAERAYNTPLADLQRRKEAGQNPALAMGGQFGQAVTTASASGTSPDAPVPGNYNPVSPRVVPDLGASAAMGTYFQAKSVGVAEKNADTNKQDADTARINANTQQFLAQYDALVKLKEAGKLESEYFNNMVDYLFKSSTLETRVESIKESLKGIRLDNHIKDFDLNNIKPAILEKISAETNLLESKLQEISTHIGLMESQTMYYEQESITSSEKALYYSRLGSKAIKEEMVAEANYHYVRALAEIERAKLPEVEYRAAHAAVTYSFERAGDVIDMLATVNDGVNKWFTPIKIGSNGNSSSTQSSNAPKKSTDVPSNPVTGNPYGSYKTPEFKKDFWDCRESVRNQILRDSPDDVKQYLLDK